MGRYDRQAKLLCALLMWSLLVLLNR